MPTDTKTCLARWAEDARLFALRRSEDYSAALTLIVCDFEYSYDRDRHAAYMMAEGKAAERKIRWPFHRIAAVSWLVARYLPGEGEVAFDEPVVLTADTSSEKDMVAAFFDACRIEPGGIVTSWGGEAKDFAVLRMAAMMHSLIVPAQLADLHPHSRNRLDLCQATSVAAASVHLPEFAAALGVPCKPSASQDIGPLVENGEWAMVAEQVLADVITTTLIAIYHLASMGQVTLDRASMLGSLADRLQRSFPNSDFCTRTFASWVRARKAEAGLRGTVYRAPAAPSEYAAKLCPTPSEGVPA
ncbi:hypothetical protein [Aurantiacibacter odishensis]|uniref:hypothetical protein n=1 Tax=Aurantiacibacter odishensis TaxID=1155476 RepID=UPI000E73246E|nr:hypothetical protein [Aurantiacibacter odishensis]